MAARKAWQDWIQWRSEVNPAFASGYLRHRQDCRAQTRGDHWQSVYAWEAEGAALSVPAAEGGPLTGLPYAAKDLFDVAGVPTGASSAFLPEVRALPERTAPLVEACQRAGAQLVAKVHLNEFAYGLSGRNKHFGNVPHPLHPERLSGGSSSGSAHAVAAGHVAFALGTDTGGSIRVPCAYCGLYGLRLSPEHPWSHEGVFALAKSFDAAGWMTADAAGMAAVTRALLDPEPSAPGKATLRGLDLTEASLLDEALRTPLDAARARLQLSQDRPRAQELAERSEALIRAFHILQSREAYALHKPWLDTLKDRYSVGVWQRIDRGRHWSAEDLAEAEAARDWAVAFFEELWQGIDYVVLPAAPGVAPREPQYSESLRQRQLSLTVPASHARLPVLTLPVPLADGLSGGLQVIYRDPSSDVPLRVLDQWQAGER